MQALIQRIEELRGFHVRLHLVKGASKTSAVDGVCQGVVDECAVLAPSSQSELFRVPLVQIAAVTQLPGEFTQADSED